MPDQDGNSCPYCAHEASHVFSKGQQRFFRCKKCSLIFSHLDDRQLDDYSHNYTETWAKEWRGVGREIIFREVLSCFSRPAGGCLLDVGCGGGKLLSLAAQDGWNVWGVDASMEKESWACESVREHIYPSLNTLPTNLRFHAVCCVNVLDQIHQPWKMLKQMGSRMEANSHLVVRLPNCRLHRIAYQFSSILPSQFRSRLLSSWFIMHEYSLEPFFLRRMLRDSGFEKVQIVPSISSSGDVYGQGRIFALFKRILATSSHLISRISGGKLLLTPSILVIAQKQGVE